jgi:hypothetical protein
LTLPEDCDIFTPIFSKNHNIILPQERMLTVSRRTGATGPSELEEAIACQIMSDGDYICPGFSDLPRVLNKTQRIYNSITAMGFSAMFVF